MKIVNLVVTTDLKQNLNLVNIASRLPNTEYNPEQFPGLVMRIKNPKTSALLFSSGKVVCTGAKSIVYARKSVRAIVNSLKKINVDVKIRPILKIQNLVGVGNLGFNINLNKLAVKLRNSEYGPEQFPGLIYKIKDPYYASFLLFSNGKLVCTGTKSVEELDKCYRKLVRDLKKIK